MTSGTTLGTCSADPSSGKQWGEKVPKIKSTILGVPIITSIVYWGLYWGPRIMGNYQIQHMAVSKLAELKFDVHDDVNVQCPLMFLATDRYAIH